MDAACVGFVSPLGMVWFSLPEPRGLHRSAGAVPPLLLETHHIAHNPVGSL